MTEKTNVSAAQLHRAAKIKGRIEELEKDLNSILRGKSKPGRAKVVEAAPPKKKKRRKKSKMSPEGRARIAAAQRKRWAKKKKAK